MNDFRYEWQDSDIEEPVLVDWGRSGSDNEPSLYRVSEQSVAYKIISGYCPKCECAKAGLFKKQAGKFECEIYRTCSECHTIFSYVEEPHGWYSDLHVYTYNGVEVDTDEIIKYIRVYPTSNKFGFLDKLDLTNFVLTETTKLLLLSIRDSGGVMYDECSHNELMARGFIIWKNKEESEYSQVVVSTDEVILSFGAKLYLVSDAS